MKYKACEQGCNMREIAVCSPEIYTSVVMQEYIQQQCLEEDKQWIYRLIDGQQSEEEHVYLDDAEFMLCRDLHPRTDLRYLVIFKDRSLRTIRDLREEHIPLLQRVQDTVNAFLDEHHSQDRDQYRIFFHYTPSVFQLHAHVSIPGAHNQSTRMHPLHVLIRNLRVCSTWYQDALILISLCRSMKALHVYRALK